MKANSAAYVARPDILGTCVKLLKQNLKTKEQATHLPLISNSKQKETAIPYSMIQLT
jgi:hypothetical protein